MSQIPADFDFKQLSVPERIKLIGRIWDSIEEEKGAPGMTESQRAELERRVEAHRKSPNDVVSWDEIRAELKQERDEASC